MYSFRNTYKLDQDTFVEDRGAPFYVRRGEELFGTLAQKFADLPVGYNAKRGSEGDNWEYEAGWPALEEAKLEKLAEIKQAFLVEEETGHCTSSLGFEADATRRSKSDIDGLVQVMEQGGLTEVPFRDYNNVTHALTLDQMKVLQLEVIQSGLDAYNHKWALEKEVEAATTPEAVQAIGW